MEAVRDAWTDERLDDLNGRVDHGFAEVGRQLQAQRSETRAEFAAVREEFAAVRAEMREEFAAVRSEMRSESAAVRTEMRDLRGEIAAMHRSTTQLAFGLVGAMTVGFLGIIATILTQA
jgi:uncharacterized coiled-coil DUF342 family protein